MTSNRGCIDYGWINFYLFFFLIMNVFVYVVITWRPCVLGWCMMLVSSLPAFAL